MIATRPYRDDDRERVVELWHACGLTRPWNPPEGDIAQLRRSGHGEIILAADADADAAERILGTIMVGHDGHRGWVYYLAVDPEAQRRGIGRVLMRAAEEWLAPRGVRKLELMVRAGNVGASGFYDRLGYEREPVVVMSRWLDGTRRQ